jgi:hypothetical protein
VLALDKLNRKVDRPTALSPKGVVQSYVLSGRSAKSYYALLACMPKVRHEPSAMTINQSFQGTHPRSSEQISKTIYPRGENEVLASEASEARSMMLLLVLFHLEQMSTSLDVVPIGTNHLPKCHWAFCYKLLATAGNADDVRLTPTSGGKADIPKPTLWARRRHRSIVEAVPLRHRGADGMVERNAGLPSECKIEFRVGGHLTSIERVCHR